MAFGREFVDLTADRDALGAVIPHPVVRQEGAPGSRPAPIPGRSNVLRFEAAFQRCLPEYNVRGLSVDAPEIVGKILYLPKGRYLIENELDLGYGWSANIWDTFAAGINLGGDWNAARLKNPFGASVLFPEALTLWLAPGAVLVPVDGAIVHIASSLVCDPMQVFDLSFGGLVVFGRRVPRLLPEWWGARPGEDAAAAIQHAIDAGLHHRVNRWEKPLNLSSGSRAPSNYGETVYGLPPIPVEFRGTYEMHGAAEVRGGQIRTRLLDIIGPRGLAGEAAATDTRPARPARDVSIDAPILLEGAWQGRRSRGAQLVARAPFSATQPEALLRLVDTRGITLRNLSLDTTAVPGLTCAHFVPRQPVVMQGMAVLRCSFEGVDGNLLVLGPLPDVVVPARLPDSPPIARAANYGADMTGFALDECDFRHQGSGYALAIRTSQTVPMRIRGTTFQGDADAMIACWEATFHLDGCRFANTRRPSAPGPSVPGFEPPDGVDVYLMNEPMKARPGLVDPAIQAEPFKAIPEVVNPAFVAAPFKDTFPAFTASGCISTSPVFLGTTRFPGSLQYTEWPVVLLNVRHVPPSLPPGHASVRWALRPGGGQYIQRVDRQRTERMGPEPPLVIVGGQYAGMLNAAYGAAPSVVVGARGLVGGLMPINRPPLPSAPVAYFRIFGLPYDQEAW